MTLVTPPSLPCVCQLVRKAFCQKSAVGWHRVWGDSVKASFYGGSGAVVILTGYGEIHHAGSIHQTSLCREIPQERTHHHATVTSGCADGDIDRWLTSVSRPQET